MCSLIHPRHSPSFDISKSRTTEDDADVTWTSRQARETQVLSTLLARLRLSYNLTVITERGAALDDNESAKPWSLEILTSE